MLASYVLFGKSQEVQITFIDEQTKEIIRDVNVELSISKPATHFWGSRSTTRQMVSCSPAGSYHFSYNLEEDWSATLSVWSRKYYLTMKRMPTHASSVLHIEKIYLQPKQNPCPLFARKLRGEDDFLEYEGMHQTKAFDCVKVDWLPPHGEGEFADMVFSLKRCIVNGQPHALFDVSFSCQDDGIMRIKEPYSKLGMYIREAPREPQLIPSITFLMPLDANGCPIFPNAENYIFRVRTKRAPNNEVVSAYFGKLYDAFVFNVKRHEGIYFRFEYYLNPTPNDRNLEYNGVQLNDPKTNSFCVPSIK